MTHTRLAGYLRLLCSAALLLAAAFPARAAQLHWEKLPDRERVSITMSESEGMAGSVGRIATDGILIPFNRVPAGLDVDSPPEGAGIFKGTREMGQSLLLMTQTPAFGFLVPTQTPKKVVIDFFHNPLGARWKPTTVAPTTEIAPEFGREPLAAPDADTQTLAADPQGTGQAFAPPPDSGTTGRSAPGAAQPPLQGEIPPPGATAHAVPETPVPAAATASLPASAPVPDAPAPTPAATAPTPTAPAPTAAVSAPIAPAPAPTTTAATPVSHLPPAAVGSTPGAQAPVAQGGPVAVALSGTPEYAADATRMASPPALELPARSLAAQTAPQAAPGTPDRTPGNTLLDTRTQTAERSAPLPLPPPPLSSAEQGTGSDVFGLVQGLDPAVPPEAPAPAAFSGGAVNAPRQPGIGSSQGTGVYGGEINIDDMGGTAAQNAAAPALAAPVPAYAPPAVPAAPAPAYAPPAAPAAPAPAYTPPAAPAAPTPAYAPPAAPAAPAPAYAPPAAPSSATVSAEITPEPTPAAPAAPLPQAAPVPAPPATPSVQAETPVTQAASGHGAPADPNAAPLPPDPLVLMPEIKAHIEAGQFAEALDKAEALLTEAALDNAQREELLHTKAEMLFVLSNNDFRASYQDISDATNTAINFNQQSPRNAGALLRLGYMNLKMGNTPEAEARFNMLRRLYPEDESVPLSYYYWGDYYFGRNELQKAADEFQYILQKYSNSKYAREAALGLARAFYRLGYYEQAFTIVDYIERRWERFYVQYPPFLNMMGDVAFRLNKLDYALKHYWLYVNLMPDGEETDIIMTRIGDIYGMQRQKAAARELYNESANRFPDKDGGLVAMMRLAEESVNDSPTIAGMFSLFDERSSYAPVDVYRKIISEHPSSSLVPLAELKLALWHLWKKDYIETLDMLSVFVNKYPKHELAPRAKEIAMQTFAVIGAESMQTERYGRMRDIWERYPIVREQGEYITPESRIALGVSYRYEGRPDEALHIVAPFFLGNKVPEYSEMALSLVLNIYLEHDQWASIREVARRVDLWELTPESRTRLDYALALAAENLNDGDEAKRLWQKLYESNQLSPADMAYAAFFLARHAERDRELEKAYFIGSEALSRLLQLAETNPNEADTGKIKSQLSSLMDVSETAGRLREALGFADQYLQYLPAKAPERQAINYRIARIQKRQGDVESWKKTLNSIIEQDPNSVYGQLAASELSAASIAQDAAKYSPTGTL